MSYSLDTQPNPLSDFNADIADLLAIRFSQACLYGPERDAQFRNMFLAANHRLPGHGSVGHAGYDAQGFSVDVGHNIQTGTAHDLNLLFPPMWLEDYMNRTASTFQYCYMRVMFAQDGIIDAEDYPLCLLVLADYAFAGTVPAEFWDHSIMEVATSIPSVAKILVDLGFVVCNAQSTKRRLSIDLTDEVHQQKRARTTTKRVPTYAEIFDMVFPDYDKTFSESAGPFGSSTVAHSSTNPPLAMMPLPVPTLPPAGSAVPSLPAAPVALAATQPPVTAASSTMPSAAQFHEWTFIDQTAVLVTYSGESKPLNPPDAHKLCITRLSSDGTTEAAIYQALVKALTDLADKEKSKLAAGELLFLNIQQVLGSQTLRRHVDDLKPLYPGATQTKPIEGRFLQSFATQLEVLQRYPMLCSRAYEQGQFSIVFHAVECPGSYRTDVKTRRKVWRCPHCDKKFTGQPKEVRKHFVEKGCDVLHALEATIAG